MKPISKTPILLAFLLVSLTHTFAQVGAIDISFGTNGVAHANNNSYSDECYAMAVQNDGKVLLAGRSTDNGTSQSDAFITRLNADGSIDNTFGTGGGVLVNIASQENFKALAIQPDGKIVTGGYYITNDAHYMVLRYSTDGTPDNTFGAGGIDTFPLYEGTLQTMVLQSDGKILLGGSDYTNANRHTHFMRLTSNGVIDSTFGTNGRVILNLATQEDEAYEMALQADGKIVAIGYKDQSNTDDLMLLRLNANGTLDNTFSNDGVAEIAGNNYYGYSLAIQPDGKIVVGGRGYSGTTYDYLVARFETNGNLDNGFATNGYALLPIGADEEEVRSVTLDSYGKILLAGTYRTPSQYFNVSVARLTASGVLDNTFGTGGIAVTDWNGIYGGYCNASRILSGDRLLFAGHFYNENSSSVDFGAARMATYCQAIDDAVSVSGTTVTAAQANATYLWLSCDSAFAHVTGATGISFTPTITGNYAVLVNLNGCLDTSICTNVVICQRSNFTIGRFGDTLSTDMGSPYQWIDCATNTPVAGATSSTFLPSISGSYAVVVDGGQGCSDTSACVNVLVTGISETTLPQVAVSPNPFTDNLQVTLPDFENGMLVELYDATGRVVVRERLTAAINNINVSRLDAGTYILCIAGGTTKYSSRLISK